jgi:hypothetical protein
MRNTVPTVDQSSLADARLRASGLLMLSQGKHPSVIGQQCGVSHQTIYNWRHAWEQEGLVGLISGHTGGRPRKLSEACLATVCELARTQALTPARHSAVERKRFMPTPFRKRSTDWGPSAARMDSASNARGCSLRKTATRKDLRACAAELIPD